VVVLAGALAWATAACGASLPTTSEAASAETAVTVCGLLRRWDNELADAMNATSRTITDADDPATANGELLDGYDAVVEIAEAHVEEADDLALPDVPERERLADELRAGAEDAVESLRAEREAAADLRRAFADEEGCEFVIQPF
jgi:hypothetical protein